jgi:hypothetical protein
MGNAGGVGHHNRAMMTGEMMGEMAEERKPRYSLFQYCILYCIYSSAALKRLANSPAKSEPLGSPVSSGQPDWEAALGNR